MQFAVIEQIIWKRILMTTNAPGDLQVPARREGAGEVEGFGEQGDAHGEVGNFLNTLRKIVILINIFRFF